MFKGDAKRKNISYEVIEHPGLPAKCIGDQRRVRQAISNVTANAIQNTTEGGVKVEMYVASSPSPDRVEIEVCITDTGVGMTSATQDQLFYSLEQVQSELMENLEEPDGSEKDGSNKSEKRPLGLGLALVARIIRNMDGQIRLKSEEGKGSRFVLQFPFDIPDSYQVPVASPEGTSTPQPPQTPGSIQVDGERTLVAPRLSRSSSGDNEVTRKNSMESIGSIKSRTSVTGSLKSQNSIKSTGSDIDKLIGAIQESHLSDPGQRSGSSHSIRPSLSKRASVDPYSPSSPQKIQSRIIEPATNQSVAPPHRRTMEQSSPGEQHISSSGMPLRALKVPEAFDIPPTAPRKGEVLGEIHDQPHQSTSSDALSPNKMRVLVAEDDPVNSRIIKKRLDKLGHTVTLTVNGEECATAFGERPKDFDVVLMDMQVC